MPTSTREQPKHSRINESFEIQVSLYVVCVGWLHAGRVELKISICTHPASCAVGLQHMTLGALRLVRATSGLKSVRAQRRSTDRAKRRSTAEWAFNESEQKRYMKAVIPISSV